MNILRTEAKIKSIKFSIKIHSRNRLINLVCTKLISFAESERTVINEKIRNEVISILNENKS